MAYNYGLAPGTTHKVSSSGSSAAYHQLHLT